MRDETEQKALPIENQQKVDAAEQKDELIEDK